MVVGVATSGATRSAAIAGQRRRRNAAYVITLFIYWGNSPAEVAAGFLNPILRSSSTSTFYINNHPPSRLLLWAAKKGKTTKSEQRAYSGEPGKGLKKTDSSNKQRSLASKNSKPSGSSSPSARRKSTPPWQVLSEKDAKKNVEQEKQRRKLVNQGVESNSIILNDDIDQAPKLLSKTFLNDAEQRLVSWKRFNPDKAPCGMRFVGSYLDNRLPPRLGVPEVAFLGRSNVGKSSLLNRLSAAANRSGSTQARVGKTPGATASVNLYTLLDAKDRELLGLVDLPGFGYAKLSRGLKESVEQAAENYLAKRRELMLGILLVDIRRSEVSDNDRGILAALFDMGVPIVVVATKADKVSGAERERCLGQIQQGLGLPENQPLCVSSVTGEGCRELWRILLEACEIGVEEFRSKYEEGSSTPDKDDEADTELPHFEDTDDLVYNQGFDWIHGSDDYIKGGEYAEEFDGEEDGNDFSDDREQEDTNSPRRETLKSLRKKARDMERRGEL